MQQDGDKLEFVKARFSADHDIILGARRKRWQFFGRDNTTLAESSKVKLDMTYIRCSEKREHVARLSPLVASVRNGTVCSIN